MEGKSNRVPLKLLHQLLKEFSPIVLTDTDRQTHTHKHTHTQRGWGQRETETEVRERERSFHIFRDGL